MIHYSDIDIKNIYMNTDFINKLDEKKLNDENKKLILFLDSIKLNMKYYRLTTNKNNGKYKKLISSDTVFLKDLNSILNKLTDNNLLKLSEKIKQKIDGKNHLKMMIMRTILEKSLVNMTYISVYIDLLTRIYTDIDSVVIQGILDDMYKSINSNINRDQSEYLQFCDKNKKIDLIICHTHLVCECEKKSLIDNKIDPLINALITEYSKSEDADDRFRSIKCLDTIFDSKYEGESLPKEYVDKLTECKSSEKSMKIKFRIMDILEKKRI
jgi:hypothetical protein